MTVDRQMLLIRNYDLFSELSEEEVESLNLLHNFMETKKGDYIYFDAHLLNKLFFIKDGFIKIGYIDEQGNEVIKEIIQEGEIFGQFTLNKNNLNGEFARAHKADVSLCMFSVDDFEKLLSANSKLALRFSKQVGQKLRNIENRLINLLRKDVRTRLINFFLMLSEHQADETADNMVFIRNFLTHEDIAQLIGSTRQTVTSFINQLEKEGLVEMSRRHIRLRDVKELQKQVSVV